MQLTRDTFLPVIVVMGILFTLAIAFDLGWRGLTRVPAERLWDIPEGDVGRGREAIMFYGCGGCHVIPGIREATGRVGPKLEGFREQIYIAGVLANVPDNLIRWIQEPQEVNPITAMPNLGVTEQDARDIAAYIYANP